MYRNLRNRSRSALISFVVILSFLFIALFNLAEIDLFENGVASLGKSKNRRDANNVESFKFPVLFKEKGFSFKIEKKHQVTLTDCKRWGVVSSVSEISEAISAIASLEGFCVVVVADKNTPITFGRNVFVLTEDAQEEIKDEFFTKGVQMEGYYFSPKNIGYIFAVRQNATAIFDLDADVVLKKNNGDRINYLNLDFSTGIINKVSNKDPDKCNSVNIHILSKPSHSFTWPRGLPLNNLKNAECKPKILKETISHDKIAIYHSLIDNFPDVDAIYSFTQPLPLFFKQERNIMFSPQEGLYAPYNSQATLFTPSAYWSLYLPISVDENVSDIFRSYITQRLLKDTDFSVAFIAPLFVRVNNDHAGINTENDLYSKAATLIDFLSSWKGKAPTLPGRIEELWIGLYENNFLKSEDVLLVQNWIKELFTVGYNFPEIILELEEEEVKPSNPDLETIIVDATGDIFEIEDSIPSNMQALNISCEENTFLMTGGSGYIGSHTIIELLACGAKVVVVDNLINSKEASLEKVAEITGLRDKIIFEKVDITNKKALEIVFARYVPFDAVFHFAALKAVGESMKKPLEYYANNVGGCNVLLDTMKKFNCKKIIFSSSATVYGDAVVPITEMSQVGVNITSPYGETKFMMEQMLRDLYASDPEWSIAMLRYFNPIGAHESGLIGDDPQGIPNNVMPYIQQVAIGKRPFVKVFGKDYDTPDGTGVRDYIHVVDLAKGHVAALNWMNNNPKKCEAFNLGTGKGTSVLELILAMEKASGKSIPYKILERRKGDVDILYADTQKAREVLGWFPLKGLKEMCHDAWNWQSSNPNGFNEVSLSTLEIKEKVDVALIINSGVMMKDRRTAIRNSWLKDANEVPRTKVAALFFMGTKGCDDEILAAVQEEAKEYKDMILMSGARYDYNDFLLKGQISMAYYIAHYDFDLLIKTDDDSYLNLKYLPTLLNLFPKEKSWGGVSIYGQPVIQEKHKNAEPKLKNKIKEFPPYVSGPLIIWTRDVVQNIIGVKIDYLPFVNDDAAYGIILLPFNLELVDLNDLHIIYPWHLPRTKCVRPEKTFCVHYVPQMDNSGVYMRNLYLNATRNEDLCSIEFGKKTDEEIREEERKKKEEEEERKKREEERKKKEEEEERKKKEEEERKKRVEEERKRKEEEERIRKDKEEQRVKEENRKKKEEEKRKREEIELREKEANEESVNIEEEENAQEDES